MMMKPMNEMSLSFLSYSANEGFARATVAAFVAQLDQLWEKYQISKQQSRKRLPTVLSMLTVMSLG